MGTLLSILDQAAGSLGAQRAASATASNNIQNANTPGYARQTAQLQANLPAEFIGSGYLGMGASVQAVTQSRDRFVEAQLPQAFAGAAFSGAGAAALGSVTALDPDATGGLTSALSGYFSGLRQLAQSPGDPGLRQAAVSDTKQLTLAFNQTARSLDDARSGLDVQLSGHLPQVNQAAQQLASLNDQVRVAQAAGGAPNDLLDARQKLADQLSTLTGATPVPDASGDLNLAFPGGGALVCGDRAAQLSTVADPSNGSHLQLTLTPTDGSPARPLAAGAVGGALGGILAARDGGLRQASDQLDALAFDLASASNAVHQAGYGLDGVTGRPLFDGVATQAGAARNLSLDAAIEADPSKLAAASTSAAAPGDATQLQALIQVESQPLSTAQAAGSALSSIISGFGAVTQQLQTQSAHDRAISDHLTGLRESTSGVSIDEEIISMTKAQQAFTAVSKVITTTNEMLNTLMHMTS
jgi:flagellar hook-associated protein 1 FlgK